MKIDDKNTASALCNLCPYNYDCEKCKNEMNKNKEDLDPYIIQECICLKCYYRWISVRPVGVKLKDLKCPGCGQFWYVIGTGEPLGEE